MQIGIQSDDGLLSQNDVAAVERQLRFELTRFETRLKRVDVRLSVVRPVRPEPVYSAVVRFTGPAVADIVVEDVESSIRLALQRSIRRAISGLRIELARRGVSENGGLPPRPSRALTG